MIFTTINNCVCIAESNNQQSAARPQYLGGGRAPEISKQLSILLHNLLLELITGDDEIISSRHIECLKVRLVNQMGKNFITFIDLG